MANRPDLLNLAALTQELAEVRDQVTPGDATHNPQALAALAIADRLLAEVVRLRAAIEGRPAGDASHLVEFREDGWTLQHPLACRPNLFACPVNRVAEQDLRQPPGVLGVFECGVNDLGDRFLLFDRVGDGDV